MSKIVPKVVNILGIRGIPAAHGGFETFAGQLAPYLQERGWQVNVYCQIDPDADGNLRADYEDDWHGIHRIHFGSRRSGSVGSILFDWRCVADAIRRPGVDLVLGYNTAIFSIAQRLAGRSVVMNMDGVEWRRAKWSLPIKIWFYLNEFVGANLASLPVADHPEIAKHLKRHGCNRAKVIAYGSDVVANAPAEPLALLGIAPNDYFVSIARVEPENSLLEIVQAFSSQPRSKKLVVLGNFREDNPYHRAVQAAASADVIFPGAIYDKSVVNALRFHARAYVHGHQVGGTNPSLVEALGAGNAVIAHDNRFNRWVAGDGQFYFSDAASLESLFATLDADGDIALTTARAAARARHHAAFQLNDILSQYETVLADFVTIPATTAEAPAQ